MENTFNFQDLLKKYEPKMIMAIDVLKRKFEGLDVGIAKPSFLSAIMVDLYGSKTPINQISSITAQSNRILSVQVWDHNNIQAVNKAILTSNLGVNTKLDGKNVYVTMPDITEVRRTELSKIMLSYSEDAKIAIRGVRRHYMDEVKQAHKDKLCSDDDEHMEAKKVQKLTDNYIDIIKKLSDKKQKDLMQV